MAFDVGSIVGHAVLNTKQWVAGITQMQQTTKGLNKTFLKIQKSALVVSAALGLVFTVAIKEADEFAKSFANVTTLLDPAITDISAMRKELLGLDDRLGSAKELSEGLYQALSASVEPAKAVMFVGEAAKFAKAALVDTNTAVDVITTSLNAYGLEAEKVTEISDQLFSVIKLGKTTGAELAAVMGQSIPLAANMGIGFEELGASIAIMTRQGIKAAEATTQFNAVVNGFLKPSKGMLKALKEIGFTSGSAAIKTLGFKGALDAVTKSAGGSKDKLAEMFQSTRALRGALALTGEGAAEFDNVLKEITNSSGAANTAFGKQELTLETLKNTAQKLFIEIGTQLLPTFYKIVNAVKDALAGFNNLDEGSKKMIVRVGLVVAAIGPLLLIFGKLKLALGSLFGPIGVAVTAVTILAQLDAAIENGSGRRAQMLKAVKKNEAARKLQVKQINLTLEGIKELDRVATIAAKNTIDRLVTETLARRNLLLLKIHELDGMWQQKALIKKLDKTLTEVQINLTNLYAKQQQLQDQAFKTSKAFWTGEKEGAEGAVDSLDKSTNNRAELLRVFSNAELERMRTEGAAMLAAQQQKEDAERKTLGKIQQWRNEAEAEDEARKIRNQESQTAFLEWSEANWASTLQSIGNVFTAFNNNRIEEIDQQLEANNGKMKGLEKQLKAAIKDEDAAKEAQIHRQIKAEGEANEVLLAEKKKLLEANRSAAAFNATVSGVAAVMAAFENGGGWPWGLIPAGIMGGIAAAQVASIISAPLPALASGGIGKGPTLVGEQGPEIVNFGSPSRVFSNEDSQSMLGKPINMSVNFNGPINSEVDIERAMNQAGKRLQNLTRSI